MRISSAAVQEAAKLGSIKYLANIAGIQHIDPVENFPMEKYDLMQRIMLRAPFYLSKLSIPHMKKSSNGTGVIGNMASVHAHICTMNKPVYNITKFGLRALSQSISAEGEGRIRSFSVSTGFVRTPLALKQIPAQAEQRAITPEEVVRDVMMGKSQVKEMMSPVETANLVHFRLLSLRKIPRGRRPVVRRRNGPDLLIPTVIVPAGPKGAGQNSSLGGRILGRPRIPRAHKHLTLEGNMRLKGSGIVAVFLSVLLIGGLAASVAAIAADTIRLGFVADVSGIGGTLLQIPEICARHVY